MRARGVATAGAGFVVLVGLAVVGCGGGGDTAGPTAPDAPVPVAATPSPPSSPTPLPLDSAPSGTWLRFDGSDDRVTVPYSPTFPTEVFSTAAWVRLSPPAGRAAIVARGEDDNSFNLSWQLYVLADGTLEVMLEDDRERNYCYPSNSCTPQGSCTVGNLMVADGSWHHVAVTRDASGTVNLYVDGGREGSCQGTGVPSSNNFQVLSVGCTFGTIGPPPGGIEPPTWFFPGLIDEPAVWSLTLSDAQVFEVFSSGVDRSSPGLVGYWSFDEGQGQTVPDLSPAANDGSLGAGPGPDAADPSWESAG